MKTLVWNAKAREFVRQLDIETKREIGTLLMMLQCGEKLSAPQAKPMNVIHPGAYELRIRDMHGIYRIIYVLTLFDKILIPHAFIKKTNKTSLSEIATSKRRLKRLINEEKS